MTGDPLDRVQRARSAASSAELAATYAEWAVTYDDDVFGALGFTGSARIAELLAEHQAVPVPVLDIGCGTGAVGVRLGELGWDAIDGIDLSPEMLAVAEATGRYRALDVADLTSDRPLPRRDYEASVSAGTFTSGHVGAEHLAPIFAAHVPEALLAWVIAEAVWPSFERALRDHGVRVLSSDLEPVRAGGPAESVMLIGRLP